MSCNLSLVYLELFVQNWVASIKANRMEHARVSIFNVTRLNVLGKWRKHIPIDIHFVDKLTDSDPDSDSIVFYL